MENCNRRKIGGIYEQKAGEYLKEQGYTILEYNYRCRIGEIDIVARDGRYLVFVEVKYRKNTKSGLPQEAVNLHKQEKISKTAYFYLVQHKLPMDTPCRFDVAAILGEEITVVKNAFSYCG